LSLNCINYNSFSIPIIGYAFKLFRPIRGLRHGFLLSSLLSCWWLRVYSRDFLEVKSNGDFKGIKMGRTIYLSHMLFVNGILIFSDCSIRDAHKLREILDLYCLATRMMVNVEKSAVSFMGVSE
jgi:hypothetical protein